MRIFKCEIFHCHSLQRRVIIRKRYNYRYFGGSLLIYALFLLGGFLINIDIYANTEVYPNQYPSVNQIPLSIAHRINLSQAIDLVLKTDLGQRFKPDIAELAQQGQIRLTNMNEWHYGESGEGCIVRDGQYQYEGYYILLNEKLSIPELASTLIHETDHYRQFKSMLNSKPSIPVKIEWLEKIAFAAQLDFIEALESQKLINRKAIFKKKWKQVFDVLTACQEANRKPSMTTLAAATKSLLELGYTSEELERIFIVKDSVHCHGIANANDSR